MVLYPSISSIASYFSLLFFVLNSFLRSYFLLQRITKSSLHCKVIGGTVAELRLIKFKRHTKGEVARKVWQERQNIIPEKHTLLTTSKAANNQRIKARKPCTQQKQKPSHTRSTRNRSSSRTVPLFIQIMAGLWPQPHFPALIPFPLISLISKDLSSLK